jgi:predicted esterase
VTDVHDTSDPHANQPVLTKGPAPPDARLTMILMHGRGGSAEDILALSDEIAATDIAYLAPQAAGRTWYPYSFLAPIAQNERGIHSAFGVVSRLIEALHADGVESRRIGLLGFSQGACLALEYTARHSNRYAAVLGLSGGLIGPPGTPRNYTGSLGQTPVFLGCSDADPHIPLERVRESADVFRRMDANVDERIYTGMGHTVNRDEIDAINHILRAVGATAPGQVSPDFRTNRRPRR